MITTSTLVLGACILAVSVGIDTVDIIRRVQERGPKGQRQIRVADAANITVKTVVLLLVISAIAWR